MKPMRMRAVVDRIEGEFAVLLIGPDEKKADFPLSCLPVLREGTVISIEICVDEEETQSRRAKAKELLRDLLNRHK